MDRRHVFTAVAAAFALMLVALAFVDRQAETTGSCPIAAPRQVFVKGMPVCVSEADTPELRSQGLSGHSGLRTNEGMLFIFPDEGIYSFWMKDMRFSIDIVWLSHDGVIVHMVEKASPDSYPDHFEPPIPALYVLELPAGYLEAYGVKVGDIVRL